MLAKALMPIAERLDRRFGWGRLPYLLGLATLVGLRERLRERNLYDTGVPEVTGPVPAAARGARRADGRFNDLDEPGMGSADAQFGRMTPAFRQDVLGTPSPREVSDALMTRKTFLPATGLNVLAAAWLQFEVHDWLSHAKEPHAGDWELEPGMPLPKAIQTPGSDPASFICRESHWWDASQLYGSREPYASEVRDDGGRLVVDDDLLRAVERGAINANAPEASLWVGLAVLQILFAREHNAIAERLAEVYPHWDGDRVYEKARLINSALMAKIHTVEWTPAMIGHPTTERAIKATWWGLLGEGVRRRHGRIGSNEILSGIPGSRTDHHAVPYSLTEEFVTVYRLHPLLPDDFTFAGVDGTFTLLDLAIGPDKLDQPRERLHEIGGVARAFSALGTAPPGQVELFNYPRTMQRWERIGGLSKVDLAAADIARTRETGVPRYTAFRQLLRMPPLNSFEELAGNNAATARIIRELYDGDLNAVDTVVGLYAEPKPPGFAFSETAFRVFLLMAARRLQSDRFFTADYTPQTYTPVGLRWIEETSMRDVLRRHYPELAPAIGENAFKAWKPASTAP